MCGEGERGDYFNVFCPMIVETEEFEGLASWLKIQDRFNITAFHPKSTGVAKWTGNSGRFLCYYFKETSALVLRSSAQLMKPSLIME
jgi:hypothetical protein